MVPTQNKTQIELGFDFDDDANCRIPGSGPNGWESIFYGPMTIIVNGYNFSEFDSVLRRTNSWLRNLEEIIFRGQKQFYFGSVTLSVNIDVKRRGGELLISADDDPKKLWKDSYVNTSLDLLDFSEQVGAFHGKIVREAVKRHPELRTNMDFINRCVFARDFFGYS